MKLFLVLLVCAAVAAAPKENPAKLDNIAEFALNNAQPNAVDSRNPLVNILIRQLINYLRRVINDGSAIFGIPPLDPLELEHLHIYIPAGLINLDLDLKDIFATGFGGFEVHRSNLDLRQMTFDLDISVPKVDIKAGHYDLTGDLFGAIPLYGKGEATFVIDEFRFRAILHLKQSDDLQSILIDRVDGASFEVPSLKSQLTGVIGGGDIDAIANALVEEVIADYVNRFQGALSNIVASIAPNAMNPFLDQLDTWRYIALLIPRS